MQMGEKLFPTHNWEYRSFIRPYGYWNDKINQKEFLLYVQKQLRITQVEQWTKVTNSQISQLGAHFLSYCIAMLNCNTMLKVENRYFIITNQSTKPYGVYSLILSFLLPAE